MRTVFGDEIEETAETDLGDLRTKISPFKFVGAIQKTGEDVIREDMAPDKAEKDYSPFMVNRTLSYYVDCVMYGQDMNLNSHVDSKMQFDYLRTVVPKRQRKYQKWIKGMKPASLNAVMEYYEVGWVKAEDMLTALTEDQIKEIKRRLGVRKNG